MKDFADLKSLRKTLKEQEEARAVASAKRIARARVAEHETNLFRTSVGQVAPLPSHDKLVPNAAPGTPLAPRQQTEDDQQVLQESLSDLFQVDQLLDDEPALSYTRSGVGPDVVRKLRKNHWPVQDEFDLHGLRRDAARDGLGQFLRQANRRNLRCVRVIHGKGLGSARQEPVLKSMVHSWLVQTEEVIAFCVAHPSEGGDGALVVLLKAAIKRPR